jgi:cytochrome P450
VKPAIDLTDLDLFEHGDPHAAFQTLRAEAPVHWNEEVDGPGFWAVTRYADVSSCYRNNQSFSSERGMLLGVNRGKGDPAAGKMLVVTDPPRHRQLRQILDKKFSARMITGMEQSVATICERLLDPCVGVEADFATDVAANIPVAAVCEMLGVPTSDQPRMLYLTSAAFGSEDKEHQFGESSEETAALAHYEIFEYMSELVAQRRRKPGTDLVSLLVSGELDGTPLTDEIVLLNCLNLLIGGDETTRHASSGGVLALAQNPDQWALLRGDPAAMVPTAIEEILRWTSPGMYALRTAREDVVVGSQRVLKNQAVVLWNVSANRDEDVFADSMTFRIDRTPNRHLTFGIGAHFCMGASLARLELRLLFETLLARVASIEIVGEPQKLRSNTMNGIKHLPVLLRPH